MNQDNHFINAFVLDSYDNPISPKWCAMCTSDKCEKCFLLMSGHPRKFVPEDGFKHEYNEILYESIKEIIEEIRRTNNGTD